MNQTCILCQRENVKLKPAKLAERANHNRLLDNDAIQLRWTMQYAEVMCFKPKATMLQKWWTKNANDWKLTIYEWMWNIPKTTFLSPSVWALRWNSYGSIVLFNTQRHNLCDLLNVTCQIQQSKANEVNERISVRLPMISISFYVIISLRTGLNLFHGIDT